MDYKTTSKLVLLNILKKFRDGMIVIYFSWITILWRIKCGAGVSCNLEYVLLWLQHLPHSDLSIFRGRPSKEDVLPDPRTMPENVARNHIFAPWVEKDRGLGIELTCSQLSQL